MRRVRGKNTSPELAVRRAAHRLGYRFRLYRKDLPGTPDIVFPGRKLALFVHGCFWHRHEGCRRCTTPKTREAFWAAKFEANVARDARSLRALEAMGWLVGVVWECQVADSSKLDRLLTQLLGDRSGCDAARGAGPVDGA